MEYQNRSKERRKMEFNHEGRFFLFGVIFGTIFLFFWNYFLNKNYSNFFIKDELVVEQLKVESNQLLLSYIDGKWISSVNDLIVTIDIDDKKEFLVVETVVGEKRNYKIMQIDKINGILGIVKLEVCNMKSDCVSSVNHIPIQLNKIFGIDKAISITYDSRLSFCSEPDDVCVRGFKRHDRD